MDTQQYLQFLKYTGHAEAVHEFVTAIGGAGCLSTLQSNLDLIPITHSSLHQVLQAHRRACVHIVCGEARSLNTRATEYAQTHVLGYTSEDDAAYLTQTQCIRPKHDVDTLLVWYIYNWILDEYNDFIE